ncbi:hypothetical protein PLICRDRAFT_567637 [Plicaturopsis crispa FD-325 SS-3]|nr:hypothetical protein PLICRDRAFT_567637 [Plicaturopsis crispa FD-325 SS-3]
MSILDVFGDAWSILALGHLVFQPGRTNRRKHGGSQSPSRLAAESHLYRLLRFSYRQGGRSSPRSASSQRDHPPAHPSAKIYILTLHFPLNYSLNHLTPRCLRCRCAPYSRFHPPRKTIDDRKKYPLTNTFHQRFKHHCARLRLLPACASLKSVRRVLQSKPTVLSKAKYSSTDSSAFPELALNPHLRLSSVSAESPLALASFRVFGWSVDGMASQKQS